jgi:hypothetical protein
MNYVTYSQFYVTLSGVKRLSFVCGKFIHNLKFKKMNRTELKGNWNEQKGKLKPIEI